MKKNLLAILILSQLLGTGCEPEAKEDVPCPNPEFEKLMADCMKSFPEEKRRFGIIGMDRWSVKESDEFFRCMGINLNEAPNFGK